MAHLEKSGDPAAGTIVNVAVLFPRRIVCLFEGSTDQSGLTIPQSGTAIDGQKGSSVLTKKVLRNGPENTFGFSCMRSVADPPEGIMSLSVSSVAQTHVRTISDIDTSFVRSFVSLAIKTGRSSSVVSPKSISGGDKANSA